MNFVLHGVAVSAGITIGHAHLVSSARLEAAPGTRVDRQWVAARLAKECIHELGHAFGLVHCIDTGCVMTRSATIRHVDAKGSAFCRSCRVRLRDLVRQEGGHG